MKVLSQEKWCAPGCVWPARWPQPLPVEAEMDVSVGINEKRPPPKGDERFT
jgi:hypothetical protein